MPGSIIGQFLCKNFDIYIYIYIERERERERERETERERERKLKNCIFFFCELVKDRDNSDCSETARKIPVFHDIIIWKSLAYEYTDKKCIQNLGEISS